MHVGCRSAGRCRYTGAGRILRPHRTEARPSMQSDVVFALTGDVRRNSRALKQLRAITALGRSTLVVDLDDPAALAPDLPGVRVLSLGRPSGNGPRFFREVHRRFTRALGSTRAAVYHASDLYVMPAAARAARRQGARLVYDARELYPFVAATAGRPWVTLFWHLLEGKYIRKADAVCTVSESIARRLVAQYGIPDPVVLFNVPEWQSVPRTNWLQERLVLPADRVIVLHQGNIQHGRGGRVLVEAMRHVRGADLVFLGGGSMRPALEQAVRVGGIERVHFLDPVLPAELLAVTASAHIGVTLLEDTCLNHRFALPNKLFEYLMADLPVVASDLPEIRGVVAGFEVGELVDPGNPASIAAGIQRLVDDPSRRAACAGRAREACETFSWEKASERFTHIYRGFPGIGPS